MTPAAGARPDCAAVLAGHRDRLLAMPGVTAVGEGSLDGGPCIRVYTLGARRPDGLPAELEGYPVVVCAGGPLQAGR